jgi:hypothetical protein
MHVGLSHFSGRHLPTIMETVLGTKKSSPSLVPAAVPYTAQDAKVIKGWAKELDNWLLRYHKPTRELFFVAKFWTGLEGYQVGNNAVRVRRISYCCSISFTSSLSYQYIIQYEVSTSPKTRHRLSGRSCSLRRGQHCSSSEWD